MATQKFKNKYRIESARLRNWDYSSNGAYYITIVTKNRKYFFGEIVSGTMNLNEIGEIAQKYWDEIPEHFSFIILDEMVVINQFKRICTIKSHKINPNFGWQSRFHDHIIRNKNALNRIRKYIKNNPQMWERDKNNNDGLWL